MPSPSPSKEIFFVILNYFFSVARCFNVLATFNLKKFPFQSDSVMHSPPQRNHTQLNSLTQPRSASPPGFILDSSISSQGFIGDSCLSTDSFTTFLVPSIRTVGQFDQQIDLPVPELPRNKLRLLEKLGEGGFGMVRPSKNIYLLKGQIYISPH